MQTSKRARRRKLDTAKTELEPLPAVLRRAGCPSSEYRKMESEGHEEKYRAVIDGETQDEPVGHKVGQVEPALLRRRRSHSPTYTKVFAVGTVRKNSV
jgi:2-keto-4-pentenoate hydratase